MTVSCPDDRTDCCARARQPGPPCWCRRSALPHTRSTDACSGDACPFRPGTSASSPSCCGTTPGCRQPIVPIKGAGFNLLGDHFHPLLVVLAPFYAVFPSGLTLLVLQAALVAVSAFVITRLGVEKLGTHGRPRDRLCLRGQLGHRQRRRRAVPRDRPRAAAACPLSRRPGAKTLAGIRPLGSPAGLREGGPRPHRARHRRRAVPARCAPAGRGSLRLGSRSGSRRRRSSSCRC